MNKRIGAVLIMLAVCLLSGSAVWAKDCNQEIVFYVNYLSENTIDSTYIDVETQILTYDQAVEKAKLHEEFLAEQQKIMGKYPRPQTDNPGKLRQWEYQIEDASVAAKKVLERLLSIHGPKATIRLFKEDCKEIKEGVIFQMKFDENLGGMRENKNKGLMFVDYSSFYKPEIITAK